MDPIDFELKKPFTFAGKDGETSCAFIQLREPTGKVSHICNAIEGLIKTAMMSMADRFVDGDLSKLAEQVEGDKNKKGDDDKPKTQHAEQLEKGEAMLMLMAGSGVDMSKLTLHCRDLFREVAYMGGEKQITVPRLDDMSHQDFRLMMGVYIANFITDW